MREFDQIWLFVEGTLNIAVPKYNKNILHACGFNNGIAISSIDDEDIQYFITETRNGNVFKFFGNDEDADGHKKLLLSIVDHLKKYMEENGPNKFILKAATKKKVAKVTSRDITKTVRGGSRKTKLVPFDPLIVSALGDSAMIEEHPDEILNEAVKKHKKTLLNKSLVALRFHTPQLFTQSVELIQWKILNDLVAVIITEDSEEDNAKKVNWGFSAIITCPYCDQPINAFQTSIVNWCSTNFDRHLKLIRPKEPVNQTVNSKDLVTAADKDDVRLQDDEKKQRKKTPNNEIEKLSLQSKPKDSLLDNTTEIVAEIPINVKIENTKACDKPPKRKKKKQPKESPIRESKTTSVPSKDKASTSITDIPINMDRVEMKNEPPKKKKKKRPKESPTQESENSSVASKSEDTASKSISDNPINMDLVETSDEPPKKKKKKRPKESPTLENETTSVPSKSKDKASKSIADIPINMDRVETKYEPPKKKKKKRPKESPTQESENTSVASKSEDTASKSISDIPINMDVVETSDETSDEPFKKKKKKQPKESPTQQSQSTSVASKSENKASKSVSKTTEKMLLDVNFTPVETDNLLCEKHIGKQNPSIRNSEEDNSEDFGDQQKKELQQSEQKSKILTASITGIVNHPKRHVLEADIKNQVKRCPKVSRVKRRATKNCKF